LTLKCVVLAYLCVGSLIQLWYLFIIHNRQEKIMASFENFQELVSAFNVETSRLGDLLQELLAKLAAGGLTADQEAAVFADLTAVRTRLAVLGTNPSDPIPTDPVV